MAEVGSNYLTIIDVVKQSGGELDVVELLTESNDIIKDAYTMECNNGDKHKSVIRTGLPDVTMKKLYGFTNPSKSTTAQVSDATGMMETFAVADPDLVKMASNPAQVRLNEASAHIEALTQKWQDLIWYGNVADNASEFDGLSVRYGALSSDPKNIGYNVVDGGGEGDDNTSVWFVTFGENHVSLLYPKGQKGGIERVDDGIITETNSEGGKRKVYQEQFKVASGITVKDWRSTCRIANIDVSAVAAKTVLLEDLMIDAFHKIDDYVGSGKTFIYANSTIRAALHKRAKDKASLLTLDEFAGKKVVSLFGIPIRRANKLLNTEELVA